MSRTITVPTESVVTFGKHGITKVEHLKVVETQINEETAEMFLGLLGSTIEETVQALETKKIISQESEVVKHGKSYESRTKPLLQGTNIVCNVQRQTKNQR